MSGCMRDKIPVSVIIMSRNEEKNIRKCVSSVLEFDEIFVVDSNSTDRTIPIAESLGAKVVNFTWNGKYPKKKQWCLENVPFSNDWVLYVDSDEVVTPKLAQEIREKISGNEDIAGYFVGYDYVFMNKTLKHGHQVFKLVLFNRRAGEFIEYDDLSAQNMGEVEGHYQPQIQGSTSILKNKMIHYDHDSIYDYFYRHNRYSDWEAIIRMKGAQPRESQPLFRRWQKKAFNALPLKWLFAFIHSYFLKLGFMDGKAGFHFAIARSMYYWQVEVKMIELRGQLSAAPTTDV
ncbi:glycosyltransferase family 2 protein [Cohnella sp. GCM10027633]|uniref:glycosyltransferase family 2 protein n=1 Tax=unclassified Cohnella TaxID=2636738 RepID=UPI00364379BC